VIVKNPVRLPRNIQTRELPGDCLSVIERDLDPYALLPKVHLPILKLRVCEEVWLRLPVIGNQHLVNHSVQRTLSARGWAGSTGRSLSCHLFVLRDHMGRLNRVQSSLEFGERSSCSQDNQRVPEVLVQVLHGTPTMATRWVRNSAHALLNLGHALG
jgi:hypothetical protein